MAVTVQLLTAEDLLQMPGAGFRYELVRGELRKMSPAGQRHGRIAARFTWRLAQYVETHHLGAVYSAETGFLLSSDPDTVRAPGVAFVIRERIEETGDVEGYWPGPPDLAVEVITPGDTDAGVEEKTTQWLEAGARMVIVINPRNRTVAVSRSLSDISILEEDAILDAGDVASGWKMAVKELFD